MEGVSYHDHNWGNLNLKKYVKGWLWTRIFFNDFTLIFWDINTNIPSEKVQVLLFMDREGNSINTTSLKVSYNQFGNENQYNVEIPQTFSVEFGYEKEYRIVVQNKRKFMTAEAPLRSFDNNLLNVWIVRSYYLFKLHYAPNLFRKWFGRVVYLQSETEGELYHNNYLEDKKIGKIEVISFAD